MSSSKVAAKRTVLITGCSDGGLGAALAIAFHEAGLHVYATARNPSKMEQLAALGIETMTLDVSSEESIAACVSKLPGLDILVNNAGAVMTMPVADTSILEAKKLFDLNVWSSVAMVQAFLPLLLKSPHKGMIVNQTSIASVLVVPFGAAYAAAKAAAAMFSNGMRLELDVFGIKVIELKTGVVRSNLIKNNKENPDRQPVLPEGSIYTPAKEIVEKSMRQDEFTEAGMDQTQWAKLVVGDLLKKNPPHVIWRGESALLARIGSVLPFGTLDGPVKKATLMDKVEEVIKRN